MANTQRRRLNASEFAAIETRIETLLPEIYQDDYERLEPVPMGSAGLQFDRNGQVAWNQMWASFCDLAMAGGPPHKGSLLQPVRITNDESGGSGYTTVVDELCRGIQMVTGLEADPSPVAGWVRVTCLSDAMAGWLLRAITMENVAVRASGTALDLPAGPAFRLEKEIKNVITVIAKTSHYWLDHTSFGAQRAIAALFAELAQDAPLIEPPQSDDDNTAAAWEMAAARAGAAITSATGLAATDTRPGGWLGITCPTVQIAIAMMRVVVTDNVLARREGILLLVPINPVRDRQSRRVISAVIRAQQFVALKQLPDRAT